MPSSVRHVVERAQTHRLVRLAGVLDAHAATDVRSLLLDVLADQPEAVVVDVTELRVVDPAAVAVLRDVRRATDDWPHAHLALCDAGDAEAWRDTGWPVWPDSGKAFAEVGPPDEATRLSVRLEPSVVAARRSRDFVTEACARWDRPELAGPACTVVTELVTNVVTHARTPMVVLVAANGPGLSVAVRDNSVIPPAFTGEPAAADAQGGRGMLIVDSVASRWGSLVLAGGKVVWALLDAEPAAQRARPRHAPGAPRHADGAAQAPQRPDRAGGGSPQLTPAASEAGRQRHGAASPETEDQRRAGPAPDARRHRNTAPQTWQQDSVGLEGRQGHRAARPPRNGASMADPARG